MYHLVVGDRQDEMLGEGVEQAEGQLVVVIAPVQRVFADVRQAVVHPAHVPLMAEAQAALRHRTADAGPGGGFLGDHQRAGVSLATTWLR